MAKLYFKVASDWEEVVKLRNEIAKLKQELKSMDSTQSPAAFKALNTQLSASTQQMDELVSEAAKAGAVMEGDFKKKIFDASQTVNGFTEKIIKTKGRLNELQKSYRDLSAKYKEAGNNTYQSAALKKQLDGVIGSINTTKDRLFNLTQQQANARLSVKKLRDEYTLYRQEGGENVDVTKQIEQAMSNMGKKLLGGYSIKEFLSNMVRVRGEFQSMQTAIETMVGKDVAARLIPQIKELAKISPLTMSDMVGAEKMMLGFNIQAEDTIKYLKAISDISMGESGKFNSLTLAFSQMSAAGKLMGQDLNQMINAGFNPLQIISEKTGKSIATLKDEMSKGAISAEMVQQAFIDATSAGGKFYNMSENASKTINGQLSMMQDALDSVFNELGTKSEGVIMSGIQMTTSLIENYETIGKVLAGLVVTYGTYRIAVMLATIAESKHTLVEIGLTNARILARRAQLALNAAMLTNPYVLVATLIVGAATAMWAFHDSATAAEKAQRKFNDEQERFTSKEEERKRKIEDLIRIIQDETETEYAKIKVYEELQRYSPALVAAYNREQLAVLSLAGSQKVLNAERDKINYDEIISQVNKYTEYVKRLSKNGDKLANVGDLFSAITGEYGLNTSWKERLNLAEEDLKKWQNALDEYNRLKKQAEEDAKPVEVKLLEAQSSRDQIIQEYNAAKIVLEQEQEKLKNSPFAVIPIDVQIRFDNAQSALKGIDSTIDNLQSEKDDKKIVVKNKEHWTNQKKEAETALNSIASSQKKLMDAGNFKGIDDTVVKNYKDNVKKLKEAEKELKVYDSSTKQENQVEKEADKQLKRQEQLAEQLLSLRRKNQQDEISLMEDGTEKKLAQIAADFEAQKQAIEKNAKELAKTNKEAGITDVNKNGLTTDQQSEIDKANKLNIDSRKKAESELYKAEADAMRDYLKEYGTFQQQKLAIAEEYAEKIRKAQNDGERLSLEKQRDSALLGIDVKAAQQKIDWQRVFGDLGMMLKEQIQPTIDNLKKITQSDGFKNSSIDDQQRIYDILSQLEKQSGTLGKDMFKDVARDLELYRNSLNAYNNAQQREIEATNALVKAKENLKNAQENGGDIEAAQQAVDEAQTSFNQASESVKILGERASENAETLKTSSEKARGALEGLAGGLNKLNSGSLSQAFDGVKDIGKSLGGKIGSAIANIDPTGIISGVLSILDVLKDGFSSIFVSLQDTLYGAIEGVLDDVFSGDIIVKPIQNAFSHMGNILDTVTFGGFSSWFGVGGNRKEVEEAINRLTDRNETLQTAIEDLTDVMESSKGTKSVAAYKDAKTLQKETEENYKKIAQEQARYSGSHHSWNYYWNGFSQEETSRLSSQIGRNWNGDIWSLSPEEMKMLRSNVDMWEKIQNAGKGGYGERLTDKLNDYIDQAGKLEELTDKLYEGLTGMSFDSMYDSFVDNLMDMKYDAKAAAEDISEYFTRAMLSNKIGEMYSDKLEDWWKKFGASMEDNELTEAEREALQDEYMQYVEEAMKLRDKLAAATGYDKIANESTSQSSTSRGFGTEMTHEDAGELSGRFTAFQITGEEIKNQAIEQTGLLSSINEKMSLLNLTNEDIPRLTANTPDIAGQTRESITSGYQPQVNVVFPDAKIDILTAEVSNLKGIVNEMRTLQVDGNLDRQEIREGVQVIAKNNPKVLANTDEIKRDIKNAI